MIAGMKSRTLTDWQAYYAVKAEEAKKKPPK